MTWKYHVNKIANKVSRINGTLNRLKRFLPKHILLTLYNTLILPHLNYGILVWGKNMGRLEKLQKWAVRSISGSKYNAHTDPLFKSMNLLKAHDLYKMCALKFYFKYQQGTLPTYFNDMFSSTTQTHNYPTRNRNQPRLPSPNTATAENAIRYSLPKILYETPCCIKDKIYTHSLNGLSKYMKHFYCSQYHDTCEMWNCYVCNRA